MSAHTWLFLPRATEAVRYSEAYTDITYSHLFPNVTCFLFLTGVVKRNGRKRNRLSFFTASEACFWFNLSFLHGLWKLKSQLLGFQIVVLFGLLDFFLHSIFKRKEWNCIRTSKYVLPIQRRTNALFMMSHECRWLPSNL